MLENFSIWGTGPIGWLIPFLFVLSVIVFFHELGHFWVARRCGVRVLTFSVGFGPEIFGFNDKHGTRWKISAIPLGGYVKFFGDENAASVPDHETAAQMNAEERKVSFFHKPVAQRAAVVAAGPIANFILAIAIFAGIFLVYGKQITSARISDVQSGSVAAQAGFQAGDLVVAINDKPIESFSDMQRIVSVNAGNQLKFEVERTGTRQVIMATPAIREVKDKFGNVSRVGMLGLTRTMAPGDVRTESVGPVKAITMGFEQTWFVIDQTMTYLGRVVMGRESADQLGGPIKIAQVSGQMASLGLLPILHLAAVLSVSIGLLNLFPIPLLDGGHLLFYAIEAIRGKPLSERAQEYGFRVGLALVVMLMVFATYNDVSGLIARLGS
ncbi:metalloprotease MmpA [Variibacter gotjawalensis]|uniref:Zinc metalloprotease n=1 Tax=Variibacter gotjawalensis TaxID=1333996 RepID=A0A0S3PWH3_9BRAD|nr:RIP metalloprotease RseP [Variibacter gotjawalensis]RZS48022.1 site-2 protease [Variibacter gotjawalensis]BAT60278.1 metalloprotease MmpA [Variibacter gotjawalensis]